MRTFVMGDIHGAYRALIQCLQRSEFDKEKDVLIHLGDVVDGWSETYECVEELLTIKNLIAIKGNHDEEFLYWMLYGTHHFNWTQGANMTAESYVKHAEREHIQIVPDNGAYTTNLTTYDIPKTHQTFFKKQQLYYIDNKNNCFVHGGFNRHKEFEGQEEFLYYWDRDLWMAAMSYEDMDNIEAKKSAKFKMKTPFKEVFIGHTALTNWNIAFPMKAANIWNIDTGAAFDGRLSIMDIHTKEVFQSDIVRTLYPHEDGRK